MTTTQVAVAKTEVENFTDRAVKKVVGEFAVPYEGQQRVLALDARKLMLSKGISPDSEEFSNGTEQRRKMAFTLFHYVANPDEL